MARVTYTKYKPTKLRNIFQNTEKTYTMENVPFEIEPTTLFSESFLWQLNRDYYQNEGIDAWRSGAVPHHMTSNSRVGKTYAELILGLLKDLSFKNKTSETVYILELGAGHGRLAFHVLQHLQKLKKSLNIELPPYRYILSDIVEENLSFFDEHPQFQILIEEGILDVCYFDAVKSTELILRHSKEKITTKKLNQPIIAIANYFFDSIPSDLFLIKDKTISSCSVALETDIDPSGMSTKSLLSNLNLKYQKIPFETPFYKNKISNHILDDYKNSLLDSHLLYPQKSLQCLVNIQSLSKQGLMVLSMDKGFHEIHDLQKLREPEIVTHGSFSVWVNFHALGKYCDKQGGKTFLPSFSSFSLELGCFLFLTDGDSYKETEATYQHFIDDFGPDDFNGMKKMVYQNISRMNIRDLIGFIRLSYYDSTFFIKLLPRLKLVLKKISFNERRRLAQTMHEVWNMYFNIDEKLDFAYELGGIFYDLGFYAEALTYFQYSVDVLGQQADIYYNVILCHYQLRQDDLFVKVLKEAKNNFPDYERFRELEKLDLGAV